MTSPMNPIILQQEGMGDAIAKGLAPLMQALQERKQRQLQQQQVLAQIGQLKLDQDKFAEDTKARNEQKKGLEQSVEGAVAQLQGLGETGPIEKELRGAYATGDPKLIEAVNDKIQRLTVQSKMKEIAGRYKDSVDPMSQYRQAVEILQADPTPANASIVATLGSQVFASAPRGQWLRANTKQQDGSYHAMATNAESGEKIDLGEVPAPYTERFAEYGDMGQRVSARTALRMRNSYDEISKYIKNDAVMNEAANALTISEGAATTPMNLGQFLGYVSNAATATQASPEAQVVLNNMFEFLAAEGFGEGGKTLTATEWAKAVRQLAPLSGEAAASRMDKYKRMGVRWRTHVRQAGPAWNKLKDLTPDEADGELKRVDELEEFMRKTQEEFGSQAETP